MDAKENKVVSTSTGLSVKSEPREVILPGFSPTESKHVKAEPTDAARVFLDRGLPIPSYVQGDIIHNSLSRTGSASDIDSVLPKSEDGEASQQTVHNHEEPPKQTYFTVYNSSDDIAHTPEGAFKEGLGMVKVIKEKLRTLELGSKLRREVWDREIATLEGECAPKTLIAVCGATGAGKSSILNAVLDDNIVPTSGMRACTAVVTEISYHKKSTIDADISFLSENDWRQELAVLLHDIVDEEGKIKRVTDLKSDAGVAWQKVHAVYPKITQEALVKMSANEIINYDANISRILGVTKTISAKDSKAFAKEIGKYIDSKDQKRGKKDKDKKDKAKSKEPSLMDKVRHVAGLPTSSKSKSKSKDDNDLDAPALWPLIRQVNVRCNAGALSTGAILVDLPGVADANAARNNIAKDYMKKCNCIWILAPITRAVDDKTARDLLGDAFKMQLMMDGNYDDHAITFVASKCDDISCSEVIRALRLEDDPVLEEIEDRLTTLRHDISDCKKRKGSAEKEVKAIKEELETIRTQYKDYESHLEALQNGETFTPAFSMPTNGKKRKNERGGKPHSSKRRRTTSDDEDNFIDDDDDEDSDDSEKSGSESESDSESASGDAEKSDSDGEAEDQDVEMEAVTEESLEEKIKECKEAIKACRERSNEARLRKKEAGDSLSSLEKILIKVQREKNAFCSLKRSEFSRDVLKEDFRTGLKDLDDAAAEERDPENFDPSRNLRDYDAIDLPVFPCSGRDYVRLTGQVKGDGEPSCFSNVEDTGVPDLRRWCHQLTVASRERSSRTFMVHLKTFAHSIQSYVKGIGDVTAIDRESLRERWESSDLNEPAQRYGVEDDDPLAEILGGLGAGLGTGLFGMGKPATKVDLDGQTSGITHRLCMDFAKLVDRCVQDLQQNFKDGLEDKCRVGAVNASSAALSTLDEFSSSMHWATYRATLRRHGAFRRDLNVELINPFTRNIAQTWSEVFESDLFGPFERDTIDTVNELVKDVEDSAAPGLKDRARLQGEASLEEARVALRKIVDLVKETMNQEQKEVSRCLAPHVQEQLIDGYDRAMEERGTGSVARQKTYFRGYVDDRKDTMFDDGADVVLERLTKAADAIGETLDEAMGKLAEKVEVSMAVLWEGARDNPQQLKARAEIIKVVETIQEQIKFWTEAEKLAQAANRYINEMKN